MHSLLKRQLKRCFGDESMPGGQWQDFIAAVEQAYHGFDNDRAMLERSLELSSEELLHANHELRAIFQAIPDLLFRVDGEGTILAVKAAEANDLLLESRDLIGRKIHELPLEEVGEQFRSATAQVVAQRAVVSIEYSLPVRGREQFYEARFAPALDDQIVVIVRNITERMELEARLRQSQKMDAIGQLAGGVAHDFNNLLTVIKGFANLIGSDQSIAGSAQEHLHEISLAADRAARLTGQLLAFSRKQSIQPRVLDFNGVVAEMTTLLQRVIGEHIALRLDCADDVPKIEADESMLEQVLLNLVVNGRDAMPDGGELVISTSCQFIDGADAPVHVEAPPGKYVCLTVRDSGRGIAPEFLSRIFEPFYTTKAPGKGTGLGLATVFGIVKQHGGWIDVDSKVGQGSVFAVYLPAAAPGGSKSTDGTIGEADSTAGTETILLVEDEGGVRRLAQVILGRAGYRVLEADSGPAALSAWKEHKDAIALLVTDLVLPAGLGGDTLAEKLLEEKPNLPILFTSGYTGLGEKPGPAVHAAARFLQKPYSTKTLLSLVRESIDASRVSST